MRLSRYNILKNIHGTNIFFNSKTCALAEVDGNFIDVIEDVQNNSYDEAQYTPQLIADMKAAGCIVEDGTDELAQLGFYRNLQKYDMQSLGLTIAPTLDCNFHCQYCFESHPKGIMDIETQTALLKFVEDRLRCAKSFSVTWYGGEPLLAKRLIYDLSEKFLSLCQKNNVEYDAFIITNASLLTDDDVCSFKQYKINGAQITIDGPREVHDKRRPNVNNTSTFDYLIDRANTLLNNGLDVVVRINIDKENIGCVDELLKTLKQRLVHFDLLKIDFGKVSAFTDVCRSIEADCYNNEQYAEMMLPLYEKVDQYGFSMNKMAVYPSPKLNYCCVDYSNSFVIDYRGDIFLCWNHVGNQKKSCGNVRDFNVRPLNNNYLTWLDWNPIHHDKCRQCNLLPVCMGGCSDARYGSADGEPVCGTIKYNIDKVIEYYYDKLKGGASQ